MKGPMFLGMIVAMGKSHETSRRDDLDLRISPVNPKFRIVPERSLNSPWISQSHDVPFHWTTWMDVACDVFPFWHLADLFVDRPHKPSQNPTRALRAAFEPRKARMRLRSSCGRPSELRSRVRSEQPGASQKKENCISPRKLGQ